MNTMKRGTYWIWTAVTFVICVFCGMVVNNASPDSAISTPIAFFCLFIQLLFIFKAVVPRLRDCGKSTYLAWLWLIPLVNAIFFIYIGCLKSKSDNLV